MNDHVTPLPGHPSPPASCAENPGATDLNRQADEVTAIVREFQKLLVRHESSLEAEGIREQVETLGRWAESYRRGIKAAQKITDTGQQWLREVQEKLLLAADELQRMDSESPASVSEEHEARAEELLRAKRRVDALIPKVEHAVAPVAGEKTETPEKEDA